jgi:hypothetical protein
MTKPVRPTRMAVERLGRSLGLDPALTIVHGTTEHDR